jgi:hypothetical protein
MKKTVYSVALQRAAIILGGAARLGEHLDVRSYQLERWLAGASPPPADVFLKVVDIVSQDSLNRMRDARDESAAGSQAAAHAYARAFARSRGDRIRLLRKSIQKDPLLTHESLSESQFMERKFGVQEAGLVLQTALDSTIAGTGAKFGTMQLLETDGLHLVVQHGFSKPFLDFFALVNDADTTCAIAMATRAQVVVGDVEVNPIYKGKPSCKALLEANVRAVQSTPLVSASGEVLGVFSTHYDRTWTPDEKDLAVIDHIGDRTAYWLDKMLDALSA